MTRARARGRLSIAIDIVKSSAVVQMVLRDTDIFIRPLSFTPNPYFYWPMRTNGLR